MSRVHDLLTEHGKEKVLKMDLPRAEVEAAVKFMSDENIGLGFVFNGLCQAFLPHKQLPDEQWWQVETDHVTLLVESGRRIVRDEDPVAVGVPYGSRARLILMYLQSQAMKTGCREIELGQSLNEWLGKLDVPVCGKNYAAIKNQAERIAYCKLSFLSTRNNRAKFTHQTLVDGITLLRRRTDDVASLETATLSKGFFDALMERGVPTSESAIRAINNNSPAIDAYLWLTYRLHSLKGPTPVSWNALHRQFGTGYSRLRAFRENFQTVLKLALAVYPEARVDVDESGDTGVVLHPSPPPVKHRPGAH